MVDIYETTKQNPNAYPPAQVVDWGKKSDAHNHGELGHIGYRCGLCALESGRSISLNTHGVDHWQDKQLAWQEECDTIQVHFDETVAAHFPDHKAVNCQTCPETTQMPPKPLPPVERSLNKKNDG